MNFFDTIKIKNNTKFLTYIVLLLLVLLINGCKVQRTTIYSQIPRQIKKQIEKNYDYNNAFYFQTFDNSGTFLFWYYKQSTVNWFSYVNGKIRNKGTFESNNDADGFSINKTNNILYKKLKEFEKTCFPALDGEFFGYIIDVSSESFLSKELVALTYISSTECLSNAEKNNFFVNDFKKIIDMNYQYIPMFD